MQQSYWHLTGNLWALALSTAIALFLPEFGPKDIMSGGVGVVIRTTMVAPIVFSLLYFTGRLITHLTNRLKKRWRMSIIMAGIEKGMEDIANRRAKQAAKEAKAAAELAAKEAIELANKEAREAIEQAVIEAKAAAELAAKEAKAAAELAAKEAKAAKEAAEQSAKSRELEREQFQQFMRVKGLSEHEIDDFVRRLDQRG